MNGSSGGKAWEGQDLEKVEEKAEQRLDPEQLQLFAQENQDMLKHYEESLDQVRYGYSLIILVEVHLLTGGIVGMRKGRCSRSQSFKALLQIISPFSPSISTN
jgi:hypothetical protein